MRRARPLPFLPLALLLPALLVVAPAAAAQEAPQLTLTLVLVGEEALCGPGGYAGGGCGKVTAADLERWAGARVVHNVGEIPPGTTITLGEEFTRALDQAPRPARPAVVLLFEWSGPQTAAVSLVRQVAGGSERRVEGRLQGERRWLDHQSLAWFLPPHRTTWTLSLGDHQWTIVTGAP